MKTIECTIKYKDKFELTQKKICYLNKEQEEIVLYNPVWDNVVILKSPNSSRIGERATYKREELKPIIGDALSITYEL